MKVFIIGASKSGRTAVAKAIAEDSYRYHYIAGSDFIESTFRPRYKQEDIEIYNQNLFNYSVNRLKLDPLFYINNVFDTIESVKDTHFIIDGIINPKDFIHLFDYNVDVA